MCKPLSIFHKCPYMLLKLFKIQTNIREQYLFRPTLPYQFKAILISCPCPFKKPGSRPKFGPLNRKTRADLISQVLARKEEVSRIGLFSWIACISSKIHRDWIFRYCILIAWVCFVAKFSGTAKNLSDWNFKKSELNFSVVFISWEVYFANHVDRKLQENCF